MCRENMCRQKHNLPLFKTIFVDIVYSSLRERRLSWMSSLLSALNATTCPLSHVPSRPVTTEWRFVQSSAVEWMMKDQTFVLGMSELNLRFGCAKEGTEAACQQFFKRKFQYKRFDGHFSALTLTHTHIISHETSASESKKNWKYKTKMNRI